MKLLMRHHLPVLAYAGPLGPRKAWNVWNWQFNQAGEMSIYHLFDVDGEILYVGKAWCPLYRFEKHQRKPWWPRVSYVHIYRVSCYEHPTERCRDLTRVALAWEGKTIDDLRPAHNIAGVR